jgi:hypothetical protein
MFVERRISNEMNERLLIPFTVEDVEAALHQMAPLKAPGPDGFNACFFQKLGHFRTGGLQSSLIFF